jgi:hypothetical protein
MDCCHGFVPYVNLRHSMLLACNIATWCVTSNSMLAWLGLCAWPRSMPLGAAVPLLLLLLLLLCSLHACWQPSCYTHMHKRLHVADHTALLSTSSAVLTPCFVWGCTPRAAVADLVPWAGLHCHPCVVKQKLQLPCMLTHLLLQHGCLLLRCWLRWHRGPGHTTGWPGRPERPSLHPD